MSSGEPDPLDRADLGKRAERQELVIKDAALLLDILLKKKTRRQRSEAIEELRDWLLDQRHKRPAHRPRTVPYSPAEDRTRYLIHVGKLALALGDPALLTRTPSVQAYLKDDQRAHGCLDAAIEAENGAPFKERETREKNISKARSLPPVFPRLQGAEWLPKSSEDSAG